MAKKQSKKEKPVLTMKPEHELFCQLYAGYGDRSCMSNGVLSYIEAFNIETSTARMFRKWKKDEKAYWDYTSQYKVAKMMAHRLLTNVDIKARIYELFKTLFSNDTVDSELLGAILQNEDKASKVAAIREFNNLKGRITKKLKLSGELKSTLPRSRIKEIAAQVLKEQK